MSTGTTILSATATARFLGHCGACDRPVSAVVEGHSSDHATIVCPDCAGGCPSQRLYGTVSVTHCNASCEGARGPVCECACSGANHGGAWAKPGEHLANEIAAYRADKARRAAQTQARRDRKAAARQDAWTLWASANADVVEWLSRDGNVAWSNFLTDMADKVEAGEELTVNMVDAVRRAMTRQAERDARLAAEAAAAASRPAPTAPPVGARRLDVTGTVTSTRSTETRYGWRHTMTVRVDDGGYRLRTTVPASLLDTQRPDGGYGVEQGDRVAFTAGEVVASDWADAPADFAEVKRPRDARLLVEAVA